MNQSSLANQGSPNFLVQLNRAISPVELRFICLQPPYTTHNFKNLRPFLKRHVPTIFNCECFNDLNKPFAKEVLRTELGHLFEHILLEKLVQLSCQHSLKDVTVSGETSWNWQLSPKGTFNISISMPPELHHLLPEALQQTQAIMDRLLHLQNRRKH